MKKCIIKEIEGDVKQYGDARRTLIEEAQKASIEQKSLMNLSPSSSLKKDGYVHAQVTTMIQHNLVSKLAINCMALSNAARLITC